MHDALTPTFFYRNERPLRGVMIDDQLWFCAYDFARLLGLHHPQALHRRLRPYQVRKARFSYATGSEGMSSSSAKEASTRPCFVSVTPSSVIWRNGLPAM
jgi:prophage antirepressor-like protein